MPRKEDGEAWTSETGNWNVAADYVKFKIMKQLMLADIYEDVALYGYEGLGDEILSYASAPNDYVRYTALRRYIRTGIKIVHNAKFALKKQGSKDQALKYKKLLQKLLSTISQLGHVVRDDVQGTTTFRIKEPARFELYIESVSRIMSLLNEPLNRNDLIFANKEEFDPIAFKKRLKDRMTQRG